MSTKFSQSSARIWNIHPPFICAFALKENHFICAVRQVNFVFQKVFFAEKRKFFLPITESFDCTPYHLRNEHRRLPRWICGRIVIIESDRSHFITYPGISRHLTYLITAKSVGLCRARSRCVSYGINVKTYNIRISQQRFRSF